MDSPTGYPIFNEFIDRYLPQGFMHISRLDPFMIDMEENLRNNNQFFYIADLLKIKILFTSWGSQKIIGLSPEQVDTSTFFVLAHPDHHERLNRAQAKLYQNGQDLFVGHQGKFFESIQIRERNANGIYFDLLLQTYSFYSEMPYKTVFTLIVATDISTFHTVKNNEHFYSGRDPSMFRYPDEKLLATGHDLSNRELEILKLIAEGSGSEQIADKLFLSVNTVNTHRRNILRKTKKSTTQEVVIQLQEKGIL